MSYSGHSGHSREKKAHANDGAQPDKGRGGPRHILWFKDKVLIREVQAYENRARQGGEGTIIFLFFLFLNLYFVLVLLSK